MSQIIYIFNWRWYWRRPRYEMDENRYLKCGPAIFHFHIDRYIQPHKFSFDLYLPVCYIYFEYEPKEKAMTENTQLVTSPKLTWLQNLICRIFRLRAVDKGYLETVEQNEQRFREQLTVILINNEGYLMDLHYKDLRAVSWKRIDIRIGLDQCQLRNVETGQIIHNENELPLQPHL